MAAAAATTDISAATGTLANALAVTSKPADPNALGASAVFDRVLTAAELAQLPTLMGV